MKKRKEVSQEQIIAASMDLRSSYADILGVFRNLQNDPERAATLESIVPDPVTAGQLLKWLLTPFDWAWAAIRTQESPGEMERVFRNLWRDCWLVFYVETEPGKGQFTTPLKNQYAFENVDMATFQGLFEACMDVVNWQMFFDRIKGVKTYYTTTEVTQILGMTRPTINKYMKEGRLQAAKFGRDWRFPAESIDQFLQKTWQKGKGKK